MPGKATWVARAVELLSERTQGVWNHGRVGRALKPLVAQHGEADVLQHLTRYLSQIQPHELRFVSVEHFARTYGAWADPTAVRPGETTEAYIQRLALA